MYSTPTLFFKYLQYLLKSSNGKGHGVHSPFVFTFIKEVLNQQPNHSLFPMIEATRKQLENNNEFVKVWDRGAGSRQTTSSDRTIKQIAKSALKPKKYSQLLHKIVAYYQPGNILELGTSLGITTCYLASGNANAKVVTMEGAPHVAEVARNNFKKIGIENITIQEGNFDDILPVYLNEITSVGFAYVDGNHRHEPTVSYFEQLLEKANEDTILIFDDIHWSEEMELAWEEIKSNNRVTLTIDLFFIGLVFVRKAQKQKEHFIIRY